MNDRQFTQEETDRVVKFVAGLPGAVAAFMAIRNARGADGALAVLDKIEEQRITPQGLWLMFKNSDGPTSIALGEAVARRIEE
jgi:hypothetical protein